MINALVFAVCAGYGVTALVCAVCAGYGVTQAFALLAPSASLPLLLFRLFNADVPTAVITHRSTDTMVASFIGIERF